MLNMLVTTKFGKCHLGITELLCKFVFLHKNTVKYSLSLSHMHMHTHAHAHTRTCTHTPIKIKPNLTHYQKSVQHPLVIPLYKTYSNWMLCCQGGARCSSVVRAFAHDAMGRRIDPSWGGPLRYFSFQPVLHDWCNKGRGMCYLVCGMVHIKESFLLIGRSSLCGGSGFPFSLSERSLTICLKPYNRE